MSDQKNRDRCVLCLDEKRSPVNVQCGHSFCSECLSVYKSYSKYSWAKKCPICRGILKEQKRLSKIKTQDSIENGNANAYYLEGPVTSASIGNNSIANSTFINPEEQTCILENFIAIAADLEVNTTESMEANASVNSNEDRLNDDFDDTDAEMTDYYDEDYRTTGDDVYYTDSDEDLYYISEEDLSAPVVVEVDLAGETTINSDSTIMTNSTISSTTSAGHWTIVSSSEPQTINSSTSSEDSDVVLVDEVD